jgi:hypothetical protein
VQELDFDGNEFYDQPSRIRHHAGKDFKQNYNLSAHRNVGGLVGLVARVPWHQVVADHEQFVDCNQQRQVDQWQPTPTNTKPISRITAEMGRCMFLAVSSDISSVDVVAIQKEVLLRTVNQTL